MNSVNEIRDPIYGFIHPTEKELKIINTSIFQRLRRVRQLAMTYLVYPGAHHTRFEHSLGVLHIASKMAELLLPEIGRRDIVRLSALLHDLGHPPFSHVTETILEKYASLPPNTPTEKVHELITLDIIRTNPQLGTLISEDDVNQIIGLLSGNKYDQSLMKEMISGPLDADKMDYLLRDSYCCGVKYGIFDLDRMLNSITEIKEQYDSHLGIKYDGINMAEQYFLSKYYMTTQVYFHKVRLITDAMIVRAIELGIELDDIECLKRVFCYRPEESYIHDYGQYWAKNDPGCFNGDTVMIFEKLA
ncbi:HD domain-containing protein [Chloroflexota bacterium]